MLFLQHILIFFRTTVQIEYIPEIIYCKNRIESGRSIFKQQKIFADIIQSIEHVLSSCDTVLIYTCLQNASLVVRGALSTKVTLQETLGSSDSQSSFHFAFSLIL
jgi:hypothetical protein